MEAGNSFVEPVLFYLDIVKGSNSARQLARRVLLPPEPSSQHPIQDLDASKLHALL